MRAADTPPNIILVFIDDMGWADFSCFGNADAATPNILAHRHANKRRGIANWLNLKAPIFFSRPPDRKHFYGRKNLPDLAVRSGKWKLLCDYDGRRPELYDLDTDPGEATNLAATRQQHATQLATRAVEWYRAVRPNR
jgi:arylsulfatase A-like enzyme